MRSPWEGLNEVQLLRELQLVLGDVPKDEAVASMKCSP